MRVARLCLIAVVGLGIGACAGPQVRSLGNGKGPAAYELRGQSLSAIETEAARLCGKGYEVLRQSQSFARAESDDTAGAQWLQPVGDWLAGMPGNQAQATVLCRG